MCSRGGHSTRIAAPPLRRTCLANMDVGDTHTSMQVNAGTLARATREARFRSCSVPDFIFSSTLRRTIALALLLVFRFLTALCAVSHLGIGGQPVMARRGLAVNNPASMETSQGHHAEHTL